MKPAKIYQQYIWIVNKLRQFREKIRSYLVETLSRY